ALHEVDDGAHAVERRVEAGAGREVAPHDLRRVRAAGEDADAVPGRAKPLDGRHAETARAARDEDGGITRSHAAIVHPRGGYWSVPTYRDEAIVLRTHKLGEADRIVTLLGRRRGRIRAVAKGVRKPSSRFGSRLEPFMLVDLQCYEG